ncbi:MAG: Transcriptional regulator, MarR family protein [Myxococcaceae bacterium]|nr:Transcriptional regulator, MarR family protein [Myxococcaceae bacterium]
MVDETIALFHRLRWVAELIYGEEGRSTARRGILRGVVRFGPQSVPTLARKRAVTRQHVQAVVDGLHADGLVLLAPNPAHARSSLVTATARGRALVERMDRIDALVLDAAATGIAARDLEITTRTLRAMREGFQDTARWEHLAPR